MKITGTNGEEIEVTDLNKAIAQADSFRGFRHQDPAHENRDKYLQAYWQDVYEKLLLQQRGAGGKG